MVLVAGIRLRAAWLPRAVVAAGVLALLGLAAANPDGLIADRNVARFEQTGRIDESYLADLSADAVPGRSAGSSRRSATACWPHRSRLGDPRTTGASWNYGREHARELLAANPPVTSTA